MNCPECGDPAKPKFYLYGAHWYRGVFTCKGKCPRVLLRAHDVGMSFWRTSWLGPKISTKRE